MYRKYARPPSGSLRRLVSSLRSWPAQKAGPLAAITTARTALSAAISVKALDSAASIASERLLRVCGRLRMSTALSLWYSSSSSGAGVSAARDTVGVVIQSIPELYLAMLTRSETMQARPEIHD